MYMLTNRKHNVWQIQKVIDGLCFSIQPVLTSEMLYAVFPAKSGVTLTPQESSGHKEIPHCIYHMTSQLAYKSNETYKPNGSKWFWMQYVTCRDDLFL